MTGEPTNYREMGRDEGLKRARWSLYANFMVERFPDTRGSYARELCAGMGTAVPERPRVPRRW